jgi:plasmid stabilization system protein ParE
MGAWRVALSEAAERDLEDAVAFLARKSPAAAERIGLELVERIFSLDALPARGGAVKGRPGLRKVVHRHYVVVYRLREAAHCVEIIRVWDARRDPASLRLP